MTLPAGRASRRSMFWLSFLVLWVATAAWSIASPVASGPDENAHIVKAAAVVRGQLSGAPDPDPEGEGTALVEVPLLYAATMNYAICYALDGAVPASCAAPLPEGELAAQLSDAPTWVVRNNPLYYAVVGLPTLLPAGDYVIYLMRLVSAALSSLVLAWGFRSFAEIPRSPLVAVGVLTALTPMVVYLNSTVNPSALEISAALTLTVSLLALVRHPDPALRRSRVAGVAVVSVVLANSRGLSPLYLGVLVLLVAVAVGPWHEFWDVIRDRHTWPWLGVVAAGTLAALAWTLGAGTLEAGGEGHPEFGFLSVAKGTLLETNDYLLVAIGRFGWLDTALPAAAYLFYAALIGLPVLLALGTGDRRARIALTAVAAVAIGLPVLIHAWQARNVGFIWTARYSMPFYVAVSVCAGFLCHEVFATLPARLGTRLVTLVTVLAGCGLPVAFVVNLHRYAVGDGGSWSATFDGLWQPPVNGLVLLALEVAALAVGAVLLIRHYRAAERADDEPAPPAAALPAPAPVTA